MYNNSTRSSAYRTANDNNGYGGMAYYTSVDCGYGDDSNHTSEGCTSDYAQSEVKYVVDAWKAEKAPAATEARLISYEDLLNDLGYENSVTCTRGCYYSGSLENVPNWVYNSNYWYWTMTPNNNSTSNVWGVDFGGSLSYFGVYSDGSDVVRPVITLSKSNLSSKDTGTNKLTVGTR